MKILLVVIASIISFSSAVSQVPDYKKYPEYKGTDLGLTYSPARSLFRIWSPPADNAQVMIYSSGSGGNAQQVVQMKKNTGGTWTAELAGDQKGKYYAFRVHIDNRWLDTVPDPYAKAVGVNGRRAMILDLKKTNPAGWEKDGLPAIPPTDAIIYELQIRDVSMDSGSGIKQKGKYAGLAETGTRNREGLSTGLDHIRDLGVTHIHLLPFFDFRSIDESRPSNNTYNWGYDPQNYNAPEGSFASNAADASVRIRELKALIHTLHNNGLRVVMDVVYNHTGSTEASVFNQLVPGYYYRHKADGKFSDATACGNETASELPMFRKFMIESLKYWVTEYHMDGFRFDLMGVHDIETMNLISKELNAIKPGILLYGEGWTAGSSPLPDDQRALKANVARLDHIAVFSDDIRDGIKGSVFDERDKGFASGKTGASESIRFGVTAACPHPQVNYSKVNYPKKAWADAPGKVVSYAECHDNHTLWDKLQASAKDVPPQARKEMHKLALSIVLTSQGVAFLHAGTEFLRTKKGVENSYNSPDSINAIDWHLKTINEDVYKYVKKLVAIRLEHPCFRMKTAAEVAANIRFLEDQPPTVIAYTINGSAMKDSWKQVLVIYNTDNGKTPFVLPEGNWKLALSSAPTVTGNTGDSQRKGGHQAEKDQYLPPYSCTIFYQ